LQGESLLHFTETKVISRASSLKRDGSCGLRTQEEESKISMEGVLKLIGLIAAVTLLSESASGATIQTDGSSRSVQSAISKAQPGDTVLIPNGTYHWASQVTVNKFVHLQGASIGGVTLIDDISSGGVMVVVNSSPAGNTSISNLVIIPGAVNGASNQSYGLGVYAGGQPVLLHDCTFYTTQSNPYNYDVQWGMNGGVIWNCTFDSLGNYIAGIEFQQQNDTDWKNPSTVGTLDTNGVRNTYVEDCTFKTAYISCSDMGDDARVVYRHCTFFNSTLYCHGQDTSPWGARQWEVYNNTFTWTGSGSGSKTVNGHTYSWTYPLNQQCWFSVRGGTGVFWGNAIDSILWKHEVIQLNVFSINRASNDIPCQTQYPAARQVGQGWIGAGGYAYANASIDGTGYTTDPICVWGNTGSGVASGEAVVGLNQYAPDDCGNGQLIENYVQQGRDYLFSAKANYTPYPYPHPLRSGSRIATSAPKQPGRLRRPPHSIR
jgi:hypothetical protein